MGRAHSSIQAAKTMMTARPINRKWTEKCERRSDTMDIMDPHW